MSKHTRPKQDTLPNPAGPLIKALRLLVADDEANAKEARRLHKDISVLQKQLKQRSKRVDARSKVHAI